jgi:hypothetical protein
MAQKIVRRVFKPRIFLEARPKPETIQVFFHDQALPPGPKDKGGYWVYDFTENSIVFHDLNFAKGDQEEVRVVYTEDAEWPHKFHMFDP